MANNNVAAPNLPVGPTAYDQRYQNQFLSILRLFFTQLTNKVNAPVPYASYYDTTTQTNPVASAVNIMQFNGSYANLEYAIRKVNNKQIYVTQTGIYNVQFSAQVDKTGGGNDHIHIWVRVNGQNVADSNSKVIIAGPNDEKIAAWNWMLLLQEGDYVELAWLSASTDMVLLTEAATVTMPAIPSVIITVTWVSAVNL